MNIAEIYEFIAKQKLGVLGRIAADGSPQSALIGIAATPELEIIFDTVKSSRKFQNLVANPRCSFVIGWADEITVQYEGTARQPEGQELERYQQIYFATWPDGPSRLRWPGITHFVVRPAWLRYSDFEQNPPLIQEFTFPPAA
jgi:pyridoxine/pyridoxamine 5'-phosphate oxidase